MELKNKVAVVTGVSKGIGLEVVKLLLEKIEGDKNPGDLKGKTPLHVAVNRGHFEIVKLLLEKIEGDKNPEDLKGKTPLHFAVINGDYEIVKLLLDNIDGEKKPAQSQWQTPPLHVAATRGNFEIFNCLNRAKWTHMDRETQTYLLSEVEKI